MDWNKTQIKYRVECNYGSKYFLNGFMAFDYFQDCRERCEHNVELWVYIVDECRGKTLSVRQELLAYYITNELSVGVKRRLKDLYGDLRKTQYHAPLLAHFSELLIKK